MCGGFVVAYTSAKINPESSIPSQLIAHLFYNFGRVSSYVIIGIGFGALGEMVAFSPSAMGYLYFVIGILMVLMGLSLMGKIKFLTSIESSLASLSIVKELFGKLIRSSSLASFYGLGLLNGFLPCGLVYFFAASAVATASWFWGGVVMLIFGLSTIPSLLGFGYLVGFLKGSGLREIMIKVAGVLIIGYGVYMSYLGFMATQGNT
jgi:sulfite exporter TauE/SafE